ncbi:MAG: molecular chaperone [Novosphingobium sp.]|nr:molecular chaperone [Novosphingobium sp.]
MKRFYKDVATSPAEGGWQVTLDGRGVKTPARTPQVAPTRALAEALAHEWAAQGEKIDATTLPMRDLADYAIDVVAADRTALIETLLGYAETDTLCYRADPEDALFRRQQEVWEPLLQSIEAEHAIRLERVSGVIHRPQPETSLATLRAVLAALDNYTLAALNTLTSLAASLAVGLAALRPDADTNALWDAASLEEDWQAELWGQDSEAMARRALRLETFRLASRFAALARQVDQGV